MKKRYKQKMKLDFIFWLCLLFIVCMCIVWAHRQAAPKSHFAHWCRLDMSSPASRIWTTVSRTKLQNPSNNSDKTEVCMNCDSCGSWCGEISSHATILMLMNHFQTPFCNHFVRQLLSASEQMRQNKLQSADKSSRLCLPYIKKWWDSCQSGTAQPSQFIGKFPICQTQIIAAGSFCWLRNDLHCLHIMQFLPGNANLYPELISQP